MFNIATEDPRMALWLIHLNSGLFKKQPSFFCLTDHERPTQGGALTYFHDIPPVEQLPSYLSQKQHKFQTRCGVYLKAVVNGHFKPERVQRVAVKVNCSIVGVALCL